MPDDRLYNISVTATNYLGFSSQTFVHQVQKEADDAEVMVTLSGSDVIEPSGTIRLQTTVTQPQCSTVTITDKIVSSVFSQGIEMEM